MSAVAGALGFLTRLPIGRSEGAWRAFRETPIAFPLAGYLVGGIVAVPVLGAHLLGIRAPGIAAIYLTSIYATTGVTHADGLADLGDAMAVQGDRDRRLAVLDDASVGAGGVLALTTVVVALALAGVALAGLPPVTAAGMVIAAEVGAKVGMAAVACLGRMTHEGLGAALVTRSGPAQLVGPLIVALPAAVFAWPTPAAAGCLVAAVVVAVGIVRWSGSRLGGANGDVFGSTNELGRVVGLHAGVVVWTLW